MRERLDVPVSVGRTTGGVMNYTCPERSRFLGGGNIGPTVEYLHEDIGTTLEYLHEDITYMVKEYYT